MCLDVYLYFRCGHTVNADIEPCSRVQNLLAHDAQKFPSLYGLNSIDHAGPHSNTKKKELLHPYLCVKTPPPPSESGDETDGPFMRSDTRNVDALCNKCNANIANFGAKGHSPKKMTDSKPSLFSPVQGRPLDLESMSEQDRFVYELTKDAPDWYENPASWAPPPIFDDDDDSLFSRNNGHGGTPIVANNPPHTINTTEAPVTDEHDHDTALPALGDGTSSASTHIEAGQHASIVNTAEVPVAVEPSDNTTLSSPENGVSNAATGIVANKQTGSALFDGGKYIMSNQNAAQKSSSGLPMIQAREWLAAASKSRSTKRKKSEVDAQPAKRACVPATINAEILTIDPMDVLKYGPTTAASMADKRKADGDTESIKNIAKSLESKQPTKRSPKKAKLSKENAKKDDAKKDDEPQVIDVDAMTRDEQFEFYRQFFLKNSKGGAINKGQGSQVTGAQAATPKSRTQATPTTGQALGPAAVPTGANLTNNAPKFTLEPPKSKEWQEANERAKQAQESSPRWNNRDLIKAKVTKTKAKPQPTKEDQARAKVYHKIAQSMAASATATVQASTPVNNVARSPAAPAAASPVPVPSPVARSPVAEYTAAGNGVYSPFNARFAPPAASRSPAYGQYATGYAAAGNGLYSPSPVRPAPTANMRGPYAGAPYRQQAPVQYGMAPPMAPPYAGGHQRVQQRGFLPDGREFVRDGEGYVRLTGA